MIKKTLSLLLTIIFIFSSSSTAFCSSVNNQKLISEMHTLPLEAIKKEELVKGLVDECYTYPISINDVEWKELNNVMEKRAVAFVSEEQGEMMTTEALMHTVLNFPLLVDLFAYEDASVAFKRVSSYCPCLALLVNRSYADIYLESYIEDHNYSDEITVLYAKRILEIISQNKTIQNGNKSYTYVYTPQGSAVAVDYNRQWSYWGTTQTAALAVHYAMVQTYPSIIILSSVSPSYNCHSYAWYSQLTSNQYWMDMPNSYYTDGSYSLSSCSAGKRITYTYDNLNDCDHSGIVVSGTGSYSTTRIRSKWGYYGVYSHYINDCPYYNSVVTISFWGAN